MANAFAVALCELLGLPDKNVTRVEVVCTPDKTTVQLEMYVMGEDGRLVIDDHGGYRAIARTLKSYELKPIGNVEAWQISSPSA